MNDMSDGIYLGALFGPAPTQYVVMNASGISIVSPTAVTITTPTLTVNGAIVATGNVTAGSIDLETHHHTGVTTGIGNTGGPAG